MPLLSQEDVSYHSNVENEPEMSKNRLGSYLRWDGSLFEYQNLRTLILCDVSCVYTHTHLHIFMVLMFQSGVFFTFNSIFPSARSPGRLMPLRTS